MKRLLIIFLGLILSGLLGLTEGFAQSETIVVGKVTSSVDGSPMAGVYVFTFKTLAEAKAEYKVASDSYQMGYMPEYFKDIRTAFDGTYEITIPMSGGVIFYKHPYKPVLVSVKGQSTINVVIEATQELPEVEVIGEVKQLTDPVIEEETVIGNIYTKKLRYQFDKSRLGEINGVGRTNARLITQVFVMKADGKDTLQYMMPQVYDGEQYHATQALWSKDTLYRIADRLPRLTNALDTVLFDVQFEIPDRSIYHCKANIWIEDYIKTYYRDSCFILSTARVRRPFQFLEYTFSECHLDHKEYMKPPRKEHVSTPKNMRLRFKVGKAELDKSDRQTVAALDSLKEELRGICSDPAAKLKEIHFAGYASPEGPYSKNKELSQARTEVVRSEVLSVVPRDQLEMVYRTSQGYVCGWGEVADILERDSLSKEAGFVRKVVDEYQDKWEKQDYFIRKSPYYLSKIKGRLEELRQVKCAHLTEVLRFLTPEEILHKYNTDEEYRTGKKMLTLNEYWHLFALIKDTVAMEGIYKRALSASVKSEGRPWALPANNLAVMYLRRGQVDTNILKPFLRDGRPMNYSEMEFDTGQRISYNNPEIIANQAQMFMLAGDFQRAVQLTDKVKTKYQLLDAICKMLGRYKLPPSDQKALFELIENSSPRNRVVMRLYRKQYDSTTVAALQALPQDEALTDYFKVQRLCRQYDGARKMKYIDFDRDEDPSLVMPSDEVLPAPTEDEINVVRNEIKILKDDIQLYSSMGLSDDVSKMEKELSEKQALLDKMLLGEETIIRSDCSVYDVAYFYLKRCFKKDPEMVDIARGDLDIDEGLMNDVLGIKNR